MGIDTDKIKTKLPGQLNKKEIGIATGKKVYDSEGNLIDTIDGPISKKELFKIKPGEKLYDSKGNVIREAKAKGGEVKGYMGGGSVHKNKKNMITTKGWGASRKT
jgi:hypothetical protein